MKTLYLVFLPLILWWYVTWSNIVQRFESMFLKIKDVPKYDMPPGVSNCCTFWKEFCISEGLTHWGGDPWYLLWDAISLPGRVLVRKKLDCDDYARLSYEVFSKTLQYCGREYEFDGLKILLYKNISKNHVIAVWKSQDSCLVVSNGAMYHAKEWVTSWKEGLLATASIGINENTGKLEC